MDNTGPFAPKPTIADHAPMADLERAPEVGTGHCTGCGAPVFIASRCDACDERDAEAMRTVFPEPRMSGIHDHAYDPTGARTLAAYSPFTPAETQTLISEDEAAQARARVKARRAKRNEARTALATMLGVEPDHPTVSLAIVYALEATTT